MAKWARTVFVLALALSLWTSYYAYAERDYGEVPYLLAYPSTKEFPADQLYYVYSGPGEHYLRGNDEARVSTNGAIRVYGEEDGWLLVEYSISQSSDRVGYIPSSHMLLGQEVPMLELAYLPAIIARNCMVTDDPKLSQRVLCYLEAGREVTFLGYFSSGWAYIEATTQEGHSVRGCVALRNLTIYPKENAMDSSLESLPVDEGTIEAYETKYIDYSYAPQPESIAWAVAQNGNLVSAYLTAASKSRRIDAFDNDLDVAWSVRKGYVETDTAECATHIIQEYDGFTVEFFDDHSMQRGIQTRYTWSGLEVGKDSVLPGTEKRLVDTREGFNIYTAHSLIEDLTDVTIEHRASGKASTITVDNNLPYAYLAYKNHFYMVAADENAQMLIRIFDDEAKLCNQAEVGSANTVHIAVKGRQIYLVMTNEQVCTIEVYDMDTLTLLNTTGFVMSKGWSIDAVYRGTERYLLLITDHITVNSVGERIGTSRLCSVTEEGTLFLIKDLDQRAVWSCQLSDGQIYVISQSVLYGWPDASFYLSRIRIE